MGDRVNLEFDIIGKYLARLQEIKELSFYQLVARRQSDRKYDSSRLAAPKEVLLRIAEAARLAPSATNSQPWHFIVVDEPNLCHKVATALTSAVTGNMKTTLPSKPQPLWYWWRSQ